MILDEATSALDAEAEAQVQDGARAPARGPHHLRGRAPPVDRGAADRIVVLRDGRIAESGTHEALVRMGGHYAGLVRLQMRGLVAA